MVKILNKIIFVVDIFPTKAIKSSLSIQPIDGGRRDAFLSLPEVFSCKWMERDILSFHFQPLSIEPQRTSCIKHWIKILLTVRILAHLYCHLYCCVIISCKLNIYKFSTRNWCGCIYFQINVILCILLIEFGSVYFFFTDVNILT